MAFRYSPYTYATCGGATGRLFSSLSERMPISDTQEMDKEKLIGPVDIPVRNCES